MSQKLYYIDTCIWLNLINKEGDETKGIPYWKIAEDLINLCRKNEIIGITSSVVLKELKYKLNKDMKCYFLRKYSFIKIITANESDYLFARTVEKVNDYQIGFGDCLHIAISKRMGAILVTRDNDLIRVGSKYIFLKRPEETF